MTAHEQIYGIHEISPGETPTIESVSPSAQNHFPPNQPKVSSPFTASTATPSNHGRPISLKPVGWERQTYFPMP